MADTRFAGRLDDATRHAVMLERLKAAEVRDFNALLPILQKQIDDVTTRMKASRLSELKRGELNAMLRILKQAQDDAVAQHTDKLLANLERLSEYEAHFEASTIEAQAQAAGVTYRVRPATPSAAWALANAVPLSATGDLLKSWVKDMTAAEVAQINKVLLRGFSEGWTNDQLKEILSGTKKMNYKDGLLPRMGRHNSTIVRTAVQHVASTSREATWKANSDIIEEYQWLSTLDSRTSEQCRSLDGRVFKIGEGPRPPIHPNCRSTTIAVLKGKLKVLSQGRTRASADGPVDASLTYYEWLQQQSAEFQKDVLGPGKFAIFKQDGMTAEKFAKLQLNSAFAPLTLDELKKLLPAAPVFNPLDVDEAVRLVSNGTLTTQAVTEAQKVSVTSYTGTAYQVINNVLRGLDDGLHAGFDVQQHIVDIADAMAANTLEHDVVLYRGLNRPTWFRDLANGQGRGTDPSPSWVGIEFEDAGFMSFSVKPQNEFVDASNIKFKYVARKGLNALGVEQFSKNPGEYEVVLPGTKFRIVEFDGTYLLVEPFEP